MSKNGDKKQRKYWNDHLRNMYLDEEGSYSYQGTYRTIKGDGKAINKKAWVFVAIMDAAVLLSGIFPATGAMDTWYVLIPYAASIICCGFITYYMFKWTTKGVSTLREYVYERTWPRIGPATLSATISSGITLIMETFFLVRNGMGEHPKGAILLLICCMTTSVLGWFLSRFIKTQEWLNLAEKER